MDQRFKYKDLSASGSNVNNPDSTSYILASDFNQDWSTSSGLKKKICQNVLNKLHILNKEQVLISFLNLT